MPLFFALLPFLVAFVMLGVLHRSAKEASALTFLSTCLVAGFIGHLALSHIMVAAVASLAELFPTALIIFSSLVFFSIHRRSGVTDLLATTLARTIPQRDLRVLLIVFGLSPLVEALCGNGVGIVITIPFLLLLDIPPFPTALLALFGQLTTSWGSMGIAFLFASSLSGLPSAIMAAQTALLLLPCFLGAGLLCLTLSGGRHALQQFWLLALGSSLVLDGGEWGWSLVLDVKLAGIAAALCTIVLLIVWSSLLMRWAGNASWQHPEHMQPSLTWRSALPTLTLIGCLLCVQFIHPLTAWLTDHGVITVPLLHFSFPIFLNLGFWLLLAATLACFLHHFSRKDIGDTLKDAGKKSWPLCLSLLLFAMSSQVLAAAGGIEAIERVLSLSGHGFVLIVPLLAAAGGWILGSNIATHAMLGQLLRETTIQVGYPLDWTFGAFSAAIVIGRMCSPTLLLLACSSAGITQESVLFRKMIPIALVGIVAIMVEFGVWMTMVPLQFSLLPAPVLLQWAMAGLCLLVGGALLWTRFHNPLQALSFESSVQTVEEGSSWYYFALSGKMTTSSITQCFLSVGAASPDAHLSKTEELTILSPPWSAWYFFSHAGKITHHSIRPCFVERVPSGHHTKIMPRQTEPLLFIPSLCPEVSHA